MYRVGLRYRIDVYLLCVRLRLHVAGLPIRNTRRLSHCLIRISSTNKRKKRLYYVGLQQYLAFSILCNRRTRTVR